VHIKAIAYHRYGSPDDIEVGEIDKPAVGTIRCS
jgi:hypothetical protein